MYSVLAGVGVGSPTGEFVGPVAVPVHQIACVEMVEMVEMTMGDFVDD